MRAIATQIQFLKSAVHPEQLIQTLNIADPVFVIDKNILSAQQWPNLLKPNFRPPIYIRGGEAAKSFHQLGKVIDQFFNCDPPLRRGASTVVVIGGGSLGDMVGMAAALYHRGISWCHVPSTWIAAVDSSHGGKTAINYKGFKNQLGCFHPPTTVALNQSLLLSCPQIHKKSAWAEIFKTALLSQHLKLHKMLHAPPTDVSFWQNLRPLIQHKHRIVSQDPLDLKDIRATLNLGHTWGHVLEAHYGMSHGEAVAWGLNFSLNLSRAVNVMTRKQHEIVMNFWQLWFGDLARPRSLSRRSAQELLLHDKKWNASRQQLKLILLKSLGQPVVKPMAVVDLLEHLTALRWVR